MATTLPVSDWIARLKKELPEFSGVIDGVVSVVGTWSKDQIDAFLVMARENKDEAQAYLLAQMDEAAFVAHAVAEGAASDAAVGRNADTVAAQKDLFTKSWSAIVSILVGLLVMG